MRTEALQPSDSYITEALIKIQTVDLTAPPNVLAKYIQVLKPFFNTAVKPQNSSCKNKDKLPIFSGFTNLRNESLPLVYLDFKGFRLIMPVSMDFPQQYRHDLLTLQVQKYSFTLLL